MEELLQKEPYYSECPEKHKSIICGFRGSSKIKDFRDNREHTHLFLSIKTRSIIGENDLRQIFKS